jgi:hypothetical protein
MLIGAISGHDKSKTLANMLLTYVCAVEKYTKVLFKIKFELFTFTTWLYTTVHVR